MSLRLASWILAIAACVGLCNIVARAEEKGAGDDLSKLNLEDLMNIEVTSVSKQKQRASEAPAAVTVITQDDIRRSHLDSVPELLRLVPGVDVARLNANTWAIGARGFNDVFANKLLVLTDGRTNYTPLFSGVFWDAQELMVADLDRIEVIRGPGATLWGANAVNGVINVTSKSARDTQGGLFEGRYGMVEQRADIRYGGKIDENTFYRVWGQFHTTDNFDSPTGKESFDGWDSLVGGFRLDRYSGSADTFTLIGNVGSMRAATDATVPILTPPLSGPLRSIDNSDSANLLARWTHVISDLSDFSIQAYVDRIDQATSGSRYTLNVADLELQHRFPLGERQEVIWGAGYRFTADDAVSNRSATYLPQRRDDYIASAFIQDDISLVKNRLHAIVGTKLEQNSYSGFEIEPSLRLLWTPSEHQSFWGSVSRAVRTPSRWEEAARVKFQTISGPGGVPILTQSQPNPHLSSENEMAYEVGWRVQASKSLSFDTTAFYNHYDHLRSFEPGASSFDPNGIPHVNVPINFRNKVSAQSYGLELAANWKVTERWRLSGSYSLLAIDTNSAGSADISTGPQLRGSSPRNQAQLHSYLDLTRQIEFDASLYGVDEVRYLKVPAYVRADLAVTWKPKENIELTVGVQNLFDPKHSEFSGLSNNIQPAQIPRTVYAQMVIRF